MWDARLALPRRAGAIQRMGDGSEQAETREREMMTKQRRGLICFLAIVAAAFGRFQELAGKGRES